MLNVTPIRHQTNYMGYALGTHQNNTKLVELQDDLQITFL